MYDLLKLFIIDVDGTLTDGGIYYDENGNELKKFCTRDAAGFFALQRLSIEITVVTGRECNATKKRMEDLKVMNLFQNVDNKFEFVSKYIYDKGFKKNEIGYIGDDLNDLQSMSLAGFIGCPSNSCREVKSISNYVSRVRGGEGAVRDIVEYYLKEKELWDNVIMEIYSSGV